MNWLQQPAYARLRDRLIDRFKSPAYQFKKIRHVLFLCGGRSSSARDWIATYLRRSHPDKLLFYAEDVWKHIASRSDLNALTMEHELAQLADLIILVVESPGTFAELGAFSLNDDLRKKLLPLISSDYRHAESFINTGPIRWINADSVYGPTIYADFSVILSVSKDIDERLKRLPRKGAESVFDITSSPKHLLFLLCDLLAVIGPAPKSHCAFYLEKILPAPPLWDVDRLLALGVSMGVIKLLEDNTGVTFYYRPLEEDKLEPFQHKRMFNLSKERAKFLSVMQNISEARSALMLLRTT